jgi:cell wall-associated NlpC family hydrolase
VEWCACFVSWCADGLGYIDAGVIPRFSSCENGIQWFRDRGQWRDGGYTPAPGDLIFFDWEGDGVSDHVGIVERAEGATVYTIEGNTSDSVARRSYAQGSVKIMGYGAPNYGISAD